MGGLWREEEGRYGNMTWTEFAAILRARVPGVEGPVEPNTLVTDLAGDDKLRLALLLGVFYDLGRRMPDDMLRTIGTLGEALDWCNTRRAAELEEERPAGPNETLTLRLRELLPEDAPRLYRGSVDPSHSYRWRYRGTTPTPRQFADDLFDGSTFAQFVLERLDSAELVGIVQCYQARLDAGTVYFAFVRTGTNGEPVSEMTVGLYLFVSYLFRTFPFRKLYAEVPGFNWAQFSSGDGTYFTVEGLLTA